MRSSGAQSKTKRSRVIRAAGVALALVVGWPLEAGAHHDEVVEKLAKGQTDLVSVASSGKQGDGDSGRGCSPGIEYSASDNGRFIAFSSHAGNLHPADGNGKLIVDVFVFDRKTRKLDLVSAMPDGSAFGPPSLPAQAPQDLCSVGASGLWSGDPAISGNGRYVAFTSTLPLTGADRPEATVLGPKVFVRDLRKKTTELVSITWDGKPASVGGSGGYPDISDDGRIITFLSAGPGRTPDMTEEKTCFSAVKVPVVDMEIGDPTGCTWQAYVRDRRNNETLLASRSDSGEEGADASVDRPFLSGNGRYVTFHTGASNLTDNEFGACADRMTRPATHVSCNDVFVHDLRTRETELVSVSRDGTAAGQSTLIFRTSARDSQVISDNGRFVAFYSESTNIAPNNPATPGSGSYAFVRDRKTGRTERVTVSSTGTMLAQTNSHRHTITDDGRYVLLSTSTRPPCLQVQGLCDPRHENYGQFILDRRTGQLDWVAFRPSPLGHEPDNAPPGSRDGGPVAFMGGNGHFIMFHGDDGDRPRVQGDTNGFIDVFVRDIERRPLSTGGFGGKAPPAPKPPEEEQPLICIEGTCIPPQSAISSFEAEGDLGDGLTEKGAKLYRASLAYRPELEDLFVKIEVERLPVASSSGIVTIPLLYGMRFTARDDTFELRAQAIGSVTNASFGLFRCSAGPAGCTEVAELKGGYGTVGENVVTSLPLDLIGLAGGGEISDIEVFSALGDYRFGTTKTLHRATVGG